MPIYTGSITLTESVADKEAIFDFWQRMAAHGRSRSHDS